MAKQEIITIRSSAGNLEDKLREWTDDGWRIVSTTRGSEWTRVWNTYKWTVVLEKEEKVVQKKPSQTDKTSDLDELIKLKKLLDDNAITQEEYDILKKKIINK